jgi:hypothetical protein
MKRIFFCLLAVMVGVVGAKSFDASLLVGKTWLCESTFDEGGVAGKGSSEGIYKKDGTFSAKTKVTYTKPQKYTLDIVENAIWKLDGDKLTGRTKTYTVTSKDAPEIAKAMEELMKVSIKQIEEYGDDEEDFNTIVELSKDKLVISSDADFGEKTVECKAK